MPSLFALITDDARLIEEKLDALLAEGVPYEEAVAKAVEQVDTMTAEKALSYGRVILSSEAKAEAIKERTKKMQERARAYDALGERLRKRMLELLPEDFSAEDADLKVKFSSRVVLDDSKLQSLENVPAEFVRVVPESKALDRVAALKAVKSGVVIEGLSLGKSTSVQIK